MDDGGDPCAVDHPIPIPIPCSIDRSAALVTAPPARIPTRVTSWGNGRHCYTPHAPLAPGGGGGRAPAAPVLPGWCGVHSPPPPPLPPPVLVTCRPGATAGGDDVVCALSFRTADADGEGDGGGWVEPGPRRSFLDEGGGGTLRHHSSIGRERRVGSLKPFQAPFTCYSCGGGPPSERELAAMVPSAQQSPSNTPSTPSSPRRVTE